MEREDNTRNYEVAMNKIIFYFSQRCIAGLHCCNIYKWHIAFIIMQHLYFSEFKNTLLIAVNTWVWMDLSCNGNTLYSFCKVWHKAELCQSWGKSNNRNFTIVPCFDKRMKKSQIYIVLHCWNRPKIFKNIILLEF